MPRLLLASTSQGKLRELRALLADVPVQLLTPADLGLRLEVEETGETFQQNALLKARAYQSATGLPSLAEDAGLEVEALGGAPGVYSARWEGDDYQRKNRLLIERLTGLPPDKRDARYVAHMALMEPGGAIYEARGVVRGRIAYEPRGSGGFGYDPIFYLPRFRRTMAQLSEQQKNLVSHRGRALRRLLPALKSALAAAR